MYPDITGVMAATGAGVIGNGNALPWNYPDELEHFRNLTRGAVVVMGRKSFAAIPQKFFDNRTPIVFSRKNTNLRAHIVETKSAFLSLIENSFQNRPIFMIGGAELATFFVTQNMLSAFILTRIHKLYPGTTVFDPGLLTGWHETPMHITPDYSIVRLTNPAPRPVHAD